MSEETIEKKVLAQAISKTDESIGKLFIVAEEDIEKDRLKISRFALFGLRTLIANEITELKKLTNQEDEK